MKQLILFALCALSIQISSFSLTAQEYLVFSINDTAERFDGREWKPLMKAQPLKGNDVVRTSKKGSLTILDNSHRKVYAVQNEKGGKVETLTSTQRAHAKSMSREAFAEVTKSMFGKQDERYSTRGGVTYRGNNTDEMLAVWLHNNVDSNFKIQKSSFIVNITATNPATRKMVNSVFVGETVELTVANESDDALFVGVIDIDAEGVWSALSTDCELIPPHSTVILPYPIEFFEPKGTDHLLLVACPEMFNLQRTLALTPDNKDMSHTDKFGASIIDIEIR